MEPLNAVVVQLAKGRACPERSGSAVRDATRKLLKSELVRAGARPNQILRAGRVWDPLGRAGGKADEDQSPQQPR